MLLYFCGHLFALWSKSAGSLALSNYPRQVLSGLPHFQRCTQDIARGMSLDFKEPQLSQLPETCPWRLPGVGLWKQGSHNLESTLVGLVLQLKKKDGESENNIRVKRGG